MEKDGEHGLILGMKRRDLLRDVVIPALASDGLCQRLVTETIELLEAAEKAK